VCDEICVYASPLLIRLVEGESVRDEILDMYTHIYNIYIHICRYMHICVHIYIYTYINVYNYKYICIYI